MTKKRKIIIFIIVLLLVAAISMCFIFKVPTRINVYRESRATYNAGLQAEQEENYLKAIQLFETIPQEYGYNYESAQQKLPELKQEYCKQISEKIIKCTMLEVPEGETAVTAKLYNKVDELLKLADKYIEFADEETKSLLEANRAWATWAKKNEYIKISCFFKGENENYLGFGVMGEIMLGFNIENETDKEIKSIYGNIIAGNGVEGAKAVIQDAALTNFAKAKKITAEGVNGVGDGCINPKENCSWSQLFDISLLDAGNNWLYTMPYSYSNWGEHDMTIHFDLLSIEYADGSVENFQTTPYGTFF